MKKEKVVRKPVVTSVMVLLIILTYAVIRYNVIKGVSWSQFPLFIFNKAISLAAVVFIALSFIIGPFAKFWPNIFVKFISLRKYFGLLGFGLASIHAIMSLLIFTPSYYQKFFSETGNLNLTGELSMLFGVLAFFIFGIVTITSFPAVEKSMKYENWLKVQRTGYIAFFFVMLHVFVMGIGGWLKPAGWPGGLLPISLIAFIVIAVALLLRITTIFLKNKK
jgi:DMSO/TMAO reductase YedYZ heme-binding membrane subunit